MSKKKIARIIGLSFVVIFLGIEIYPIIWMLLVSFKTPSEFVEYPIYTFPKSFYLTNFVDAWTVGRMSRFLRNSTIATVPSILITGLLSSMIGFALTKMRFRLRQLTTAVFLSGILIPIQVCLIPLFMIYRQIGLLNHLYGLSLSYTAFGLAISIFLFISFYNYLPDDLLEAAVIDGCNVYRMFFSIVFPLVKNAMVTVLVIQFFGAWNDLIFSMTLVSNQNLKTIQSGLLFFQDERGSKEWGPIFASVSISVLPTIILYATLNKIVVEGMTAGAVKG